MKQGFRLTKLLLLLVFFVTTWMACQASTMFVKGTVSPYYKIGDGAYSQMTDYVTASDGVLWYYADVTSGSAVTFASNSSGDNASPTITFASGSNSYFYYNNGTGVNLTSQKTNATCVYFSAGSWWTDDNAAFFCHMWGNNAGTIWPGEAGTVVGGTGSTSIIAFAHDFAATGIKFVRLNPDELKASGIWNQTTDITGNNLTNGAHYTVTDADSNKAYNSKSETFVVNAWPTRTEAFYLMDNHSGAWNINTGTAFAVNGTSATLNDVELSYGDYFFFSTAQASSADDWSSIAPYRYGPSSGTTTMTSGEPYTAATGNDNSYQPEKSGVWSFDYNLSNNQWTGTLTAATVGTKWYLVTSYGANNFAWSRPLEMTQDGNTFSYTKTLSAGDYFIFAQQVGSDWSSTTRYTCTGGDVTITAGTSYTATRGGASAYQVPTTGVWTFTYDYLTDQWSASREDINTGSLYIVGNANGNPWETNVGIEMTATNDERTQFRAEKILLTPGNSGFAFATMLCSTADDWTTLNNHRYGSNANGSTWVFTEDKLGTLQNILKIENDDDKNFAVSSGGYYDIEVDLTAMTVKLTHAYHALYMYYGHSGSTTWNANGGVNMMTSDGDTYTLSNIELKSGDTFQFTTHLGTAASTWPDASYRLGAKDGRRTLSSDDLNQVLSNALAYAAPNDFVMGEETDGTYRVVVNLTDKSVTLYNMATMLSGKTIIHLEKNNNATNPLIWAYDKERNVGDTDYIHVDRPSRDEIATNRKKLLVCVPPHKVTTVGGRTWWTWEVPDAMTDFWFTRGSYQYNPDATNPDDENADMTDIQWRKSGELFFTWPNTGTALEDYTRDYYAAAAQEAADCAVMIEGHLYAYFTNTPGWEHVFCHAWYTDENGVNHDLLKNDYTDPDAVDAWFPGAPCDMVGYDKDGYEVWRIDLTAYGITTMPVGIIFDNGIQTKSVTVDGVTRTVLFDFATGELAAEGMLKEQTSDFVYSTGTCYDYCGVIVLGRSLGNIIRNGIVEGPVYTIEEDLVGVYVDPLAKTKIMVDGVEHTVYGALYCKDINNFVSTNYVEKSLQQNGEIDYVLDLTSLMGDKTRYDQSNWVKLTLSTLYPENIATLSREDQIALLKNYENKLLPKNTVHAQLVNNMNPEMRLALADALPAVDKCTDYTYDPNVFVTANFIGTQESEVSYLDGNRYFLVTPKPQEYATITWAVYGGNNQFFVPIRQAYTTSNGEHAFMNEADLDGYFPVSWDLMAKPNWMEEGVNKNGEHTGQAYKFHAIIRLANDASVPTASNAPQRAPQAPQHEPSLPSQPYKYNVTTSKYIVSPIDITNDESTGGVVTAVSETRAARSVESVRYYNLAGMMSLQPFEGVNIIVTTYSDGTNKTSKAIY